MKYEIKLHDSKTREKSIAIFFPTYGQQYKMVSL